MRTVCKAVRDRKSYLGCNNSEEGGQDGTGTWKEECSRIGEPVDGRLWYYCSAIASGHCDEKLTTQDDYTSFRSVSTYKIKISVCGTVSSSRGIVSGYRVVLGGRCATAIGYIATL